jgi:beta-glucosidase/6-phospho-beta-glucosidase/beta-galactosidase
MQPLRTLAGRHGHYQKAWIESLPFSISWSRVLPRRGEVNQEGLQFYINLVDALLKPVLSQW